MKSFDFDSLKGVTDVCFVVCNGNELWYRHSSGKEILVDYAN